eukprot:scaffold2813_cov121-Isochrysis_galbana.AAC.2
MAMAICAHHNDAAPTPSPARPGRAGSRGERLGGALSVLSRPQCPEHPKTATRRRRRMGAGDIAPRLRCSATRFCSRLQTIGPHGSGDG